MAKVLIVDDEQLVIEKARRALVRTGHEVYTANSGVLADRVATGMDRIDVLIVNSWIPPETGREIAERVLKLHPRTHVVHISGYPRATLESAGSLTPGSSFLAKPFRIPQIQNHVSQVLGALRTQRFPLAEVKSDQNPTGQSDAVIGADPAPHSCEAEQTVPSDRRFA